MKKLSSFLMMMGILFASTNVHSQEISYKFSTKEAKRIYGDVVIMPFGSSYPIKVGTLSKGLLKVDLFQIEMKTISDDVIFESISDITERIPFTCEKYPDDFPKSEIAQSGSFVVLDHEGLMVAEIFAVTDLKLENWLVSSGHEPPVNASYFEVVYADFDAEINSECSNYLENSNEIYQTNFYDLKLKKGFNLMEYRIEKVGKPNSDFEIPIKTTTTNKENMDLKNIKWTLNTIEGC